MPRLILVICLFTLIATPTLSFEFLDYEEQYDWSGGSNVETLELKLDKSNVTITAGEQISITGITRVENESYLDNTRIVTESKGKTTKCEVIYPNDLGRRGYDKYKGVAVDLTIAVPENTILKIEGTDGEVNVTGVRYIFIETESGPCVVRGAETVNIESEQGDVYVSDAKSVKIKADGSDVTIENVYDEIDVSIGGGDLIVLNNEHITDGANATDIANLKTSGGRIETDLDTSGSASENYKLETTSGNVTVNLTAEGTDTDLRATTRSGYIETDTTETSSRLNDFEKHYGRGNEGSENLIIKTSSGQVDINDIEKTIFDGE